MRLRGQEPSGRDPDSQGMDDSGDKTDEVVVGSKTPGESGRSTRRRRVSRRRAVSGGRGNGRPQAWRLATELYSLSVLRPEVQTLSLGGNEGIVGPLSLRGSRAQSPQRLVAARACGHFTNPQDHVRRPLRSVPTSLSPLQDPSPTVPYDRRAQHGGRGETPRMRSLANRTPARRRGQHPPSQPR